MNPFRLLTASLFLAPMLLSAQPPLGQWRDHFPYRQAIAVAQGSNGEGYAATINAVFKLDPVSGETERFTKVNALNDVNIRTIAYNDELRTLVVGYANGNVDLIAPDRSQNISDIKRSNIVGDKSVYKVRFQGTTAFLACGFGIVVLDLAALEVRDTWLIGPNGSQLVVNDLTFFQDSIYAATNNGLYAAYRLAPNLAAFTNWYRRNDMPLPTAKYNAVTGFGGRLFVNFSNNASESDTLYYFNGTWQRASGLFGVRNHSLSVTPDGQRIVIPHSYDVSEHFQDLTLYRLSYSFFGAPMTPADAIPASNGDIWIADRGYGLCRHNGDDRGVPAYPNGPSTASCIDMSVEKGALYVATGAVADNWTGRLLRQGVHHFTEGRWATTDATNDALMASGANVYGAAVLDVMAVAVDPKEGEHVLVGSWDDGLVEMRNGSVQQIWNASNSTLAADPVYGAEQPVFVAGVAFDLDGNAWMTNSNVESPVAVRTASGSWRSFNPGAVLGNNKLLGAIVPAAFSGYKWIIRPRGNGVLVFNDNGTISQPADDQYKVLNTFIGQGALPSMEVFSMAEDLDGQIWFGTGKGIAVLYDQSAVFSGGSFDVQQILVEVNGNLQILLETEAVSAIAVDGANRKWLGTQSAGVFLVSKDGTQQIHHFTMDNSPLPSNTVTSLAIDGATGEVYIGTDQGIVSFRADATAGEVEATCASVFPNPVHPHHTGPIAITGLARDSDVRITDIAGNLVFRTVSRGGQAIWPGTDMSGNRVATGVYLALATDPFGSTKCNTRILVVR